MAIVSLFAKSIATVVDRDELCPARRRWNCGLPHGIRTLAIGVLPAAGVTRSMVRELAFCRHHLSFERRCLDRWRHCGGCDLLELARSVLERDHGGCFFSRRYLVATKVALAAR